MTSVTDVTVLDIGQEIVPTTVTMVGLGEEAEEGEGEEEEEEEDTDLHLQGGDEDQGVVLETDVGEDQGQGHDLGAGVTARTGRGGQGHTAMTGKGARGGVIPTAGLNREVHQKARVGLQSQSPEVGQRVAVQMQLMVKTDLSLCHDQGRGQGVLQIEVQMNLMQKHACFRCFDRLIMIKVAMRTLTECI